MTKTLIEKMEAKGSPRSWIIEVSTNIAKMVTLNLRLAERGETIDTLAREKEALEISLAEYENDETARRREDALKIRTLESQLAALRDEMEPVIAQIDQRKTYTAPEEANGNET